MELTTYQTARYWYVRSSRRKRRSLGAVGVCVHVVYLPTVSPEVETFALRGGVGAERYMLCKVGRVWRPVTTPIMWSQASIAGFHEGMRAVAEIAMRPTATFRPSRTRHRWCPSPGASHAGTWTVGPR